jgi:hypothetical protein
MPGTLWRIILAVIAVVLVWELIPPLSRILHLSLSADVLKVLTVCIAGLVVYYVLRPVFPPPRA